MPPFLLPPFFLVNFLFFACFLRCLPPFFCGGGGEGASLKKGSRRAPFFKLAWVYREDMEPDGVDSEAHAHGVAMFRPYVSEKGKSALSPFLPFSLSPFPFFPLFPRLLLFPPFASPSRRCPERPLEGYTSLGLRPSVEFSCHKRLSLRVFRGALAFLRPLHALAGCWTLHECLAVLEISRTSPQSATSSNPNQKLSGPVRDTPPYRLQDPFEIVSQRWVSHPFALFSWGIAEVSLRYPFEGGEYRTFTLHVLPWGNGQKSAINLRKSWEILRNLTPGYLFLC